MPEYGYYEKIPRLQSIQTFIDYLKTKKTVSGIEREGEQVLFIERKPRYSNLKVFMTNIYIVGITDVYDILKQESDLNAIVTMTTYNSYTNEAKEYCKENGIGLFRFSEFMGAVYYDGKRFLDYLPKGERKKGNS